MRNKIKAVVFDLGGVLVQAPKTFWKGTKGSFALREEFGTGNLSTPQFISKGAKLLNIDKKKFFEKYCRAYCRNRHVNKSVFKIYKKICADKYILSDTNPLDERLFLRKKAMKIFRLSRNVFLSHKIKMRKSKTSTFRFLSKRIGVPPKNILFVDDIHDNIRGAKGTGINTILFKNAKQLSRGLKRFGVL